jgi:hypothetical protein
MSIAQSPALIRRLFADSTKRNIDVRDQLLPANNLLSDRALPAAGAAAIEHRGAAASVGRSTSDQRRAFVLSVVQPGLA